MSDPEERTAEDTDDGSDDGSDEVLVPEIVDGGPAPRGPSAKGSPERRATYALYSGFASLLLLFLLPILPIVALCAGAAIYFGAKVLREVDPAQGSQRTRKRGKIGMVAGITTVVIYGALAVYYVGFYDPPDPLAPDFVDDKGTGQAEG